MEDHNPPESGGTESGAAASEGARDAATSSGRTLKIVGVVVPIAAGLVEIAHTVAQWIAGS